MSPYRTQAPDTTREIEDLLFRAYRCMSGVAKLRRIGDLGKLADAVARMDVQRRYPGADERELRLRLAARRYDRETMVSLFGWDPEIEGY